MTAKQIFDGVWVGVSTDRKPGFPTARSGNIFFERDTKAIFVLLQQWTKFGGDASSASVDWPDITGDQSTVNLSGFNNDTGFLTSFTETDPVFGASAAAGITSTQIGNWDIAFGWGDHATQGYLTAEVNDLTAAVTWANVPDANITESSVVQHEGALSIDADNIVANNTPTDGQVLSFDATSGALLWVDPQIVSGALALTSISPTTGDEAGGTAVTLTVENADTGTAATVDFGADPATNVVVVGSTEITCDSPAGTGTVDVTVTQNSDSDTLVGAFEFIAAAGGTWDPSQITGSVWFDFTESAYRTLNTSGEVTKVEDVNGGTFTFSASSGIDLVTDVTVGEVAEFTTLRMGANFNNGGNVGAGDSSYYEWAVFRPDNATNTGFVWANAAVYGDGGSGFHNMMIRDEGSGPEVLAYHWDGSASFTSQSISLSEWIMASQEFSGGSIRLRLNGDTESTVTANSQQGSLPADLGSSGFNGRIAMRGYLLEAPSNSDRQKLEGWAMHKLGLESELPSSHPYKSSPP